MAASLSFSRRKPFSLFGVDTPLCGVSMQFLTASLNAAFSSPDRQRRFRRCLSENDIDKKCSSPEPALRRLTGEGGAGGGSGAFWRIFFLKLFLKYLFPPGARPTAFLGVGRLGGGEWEAAKRENACVTVYSGKTVFRHDITPTYCAISIPTRRSAASKRRLRRCGYVRGGGRLLCFSFLMICNSVPFDLERCDM